MATGLYAVSRSLERGERPGIGTALVALPLGGLVMLTGHSWAALFLWAWSIGVVSGVDTLLKPILIRWSGMELHTALVFLSLLGGVLMFGVAGAALFLSSRAGQSF